MSSCSSSFSSSLAWHSAYITRDLLRRPGLRSDGCPSGWPGDVSCGFASLACSGFFARPRLPSLGRVRLPELPHPVLAHLRHWARPPLFHSAFANASYSQKVLHSRHSLMRTSSAGAYHHPGVSNFGASSYHSAGISRISLCWPESSAFRRLLSDFRFRRVWHRDCLVLSSHPRTWALKRRSMI